MSANFPWITNDRAAARKLRRADEQFTAARARAADLPLAEKVEAYRAAKAALEAAYAKVVP